MIRSNFNRREKLSDFDNLFWFRQKILPFNRVFLDQIGEVMLNEYRTISYCFLVDKYNKNE